MIDAAQRAAEAAQALQRLRDKFFGAARRSLRFHVAPRYSGGSPALVNEKTALRVAAQEKESYEHALDGTYGEAQMWRARVLGLAGIAYAAFEKGAGRKFRWHRWDLITSTYTIHLHEADLHDQGFVAFNQLPAWSRKDHPHAPYEADVRHLYYRLVGGHIEIYAPERVTE